MQTAKLQIQSKDNDSNWYLHIEDDCKDILSSCNNDSDYSQASDDINIGNQAFGDGNNVNIVQAFVNSNCYLQSKIEFNACHQVTSKKNFAREDTIALATNEAFERVIISCL